MTDMYQLTLLHLAEEIETTFSDDLDYSTLNPGVRQLVRWLRQQGFVTVSSGDGVTHECACDADFPYVTILVEPPEQLVAEVKRLDRLLLNLGVVCAPLDPEVPAAQAAPFLQGTYLPAAMRDQAVIELYNVTDSIFHSEG